MKAFLKNMRDIIKCFLLFFIVFINAQEVKKDTLKYTDIETVILNDKDYEKIDYSFGLKQENNVRLIQIVYAEEGVKFRNNLGKKGRISNVILFLHKTDSKVNLTNLEINFYKIDSLTGQPSEKINKQQIIYVPKNKSRGSVKINVEDHHIPFPVGGVLVAVKWLPNEFKDRKVGPSLRATNYEEQITYSRFNDGKWFKSLNISRKLDMYTNAMIGIEVYIKKKKKNE